MPIEPPEIPPATPGSPSEPPLETPPGNPRPEVPPPVSEPGEPPQPDELPGQTPKSFRCEVRTDRARPRLRLMPESAICPARARPESGRDGHIGGNNVI